MEYESRLIENVLNIPRNLQNISNDQANQIIINQIHQGLPSANLNHSSNFQNNQSTTINSESSATNSNTSSSSSAAAAAAPSTSNTQSSAAASSSNNTATTSTNQNNNTYKNYDKNETKTR